MDSVSNDNTQITLLDRQVWMPTAEDVIVTKLHWSFLIHRPKDWEDVRNVIAQARLGTSAEEHERFFRGLLGDIDRGRQLEFSPAAPGNGSRSGGPCGRQRKSRGGQARD